MQCRAPAGGWRRPAPSEKRGGWELGWARARAPGEAEGTRETPARCSLPPPPPGEAPPGRAVSKFRGERGGRGGRGGDARARRRRACSLLAWRRGARRRRPAGASRSRALPCALSTPPLTLGVHASARARPGQRARRGPGGLAPAALGRGACAREGGGAGTVSRGRCAAGWLPAWARLRGEAAHWATRVPRAGSISSACAGAVVAPGAPVPGQGPWARGWESPAAPGDGRLMGVVDEARHAGGEELPLAPRVSWRKGQVGVLGIEEGRMYLEIRGTTSISFWLIACNCRCQRELSFGLFETLKIQNSV